MEWFLIQETAYTGTKIRRVWLVDDRRERHCYWIKNISKKLSIKIIVSTCIIVYKYNNYLIASGLGVPSGSSRAKWTAHFSTEGRWPNLKPQARHLFRTHRTQYKISSKSLMIWKLSYIFYSLIVLVTFLVLYVGAFALELNQEMERASSRWQWNILIRSRLVVGFVQHPVFPPPAVVLCFMKLTIGNF